VLGHDWHDHVQHLYSKTLGGARDENERERTGNIINRFCYHIFSLGTGAGQSEVETGAGYTGIRKR
jgi:hypothetical protein